MAMPDNAPHNALARAMATPKPAIDWSVIAPARPMIGPPPTADVESEVTRRKAQGLYPCTVAAMSARFRALGYVLDRSMDCAGVARLSSGDSYPVVTTGVKEADTGLSAFNVAARRDDAFRQMQALRQETYAVVRGRILEA